MNNREDNAFLAEKAIKAVGYDKEEAVTDLLADLMHYCELKGEDFHDHLQSAYLHYFKEIEEDDTT